MAKTSTDGILAVICIMSEPDRSVPNKIPERMMPSGLLLASSDTAMPS